jgi:hypothetical protein
VTGHAPIWKYDVTSYNNKAHVPSAKQWVIHVPKLHNQQITGIYNVICTALIIVAMDSVRIATHNMQYHIVTKTTQVDASIH